MHLFLCTDILSDIKTLLFYGTLAYKPLFQEVFIFSLAKKNNVSTFKKKLCYILEDFCLLYSG